MKSLFLAIAALLVFGSVGVYAARQDDGVPSSALYGSSKTLKVGHRNILNATIDCQKLVPKLRPRVCGPLPTIVGLQGTAGLNGTNGNPGPRGNVGKEGAPGPKGDPGKDGTIEGAGTLDVCVVGNSIHPGSCADNDNGGNGTDYILLTKTT